MYSNINLNYNGTTRSGLKSGLWKFPPRLKIDA